MKVGKRDWGPHNIIPRQEIGENMTLDVFVVPLSFLDLSMA